MFCGDFLKKLSGNGFGVLIKIKVGFEKQVLQMNVFFFLRKGEQMKVTKTPQQNRNTCIKKKFAHPEIRNAKGTYFQLFLTYFLVISQV